MDLKDQVKNRVSILDVARLYAEVKPAGKYYKALCPFHTEKTPSFIIRPEQNTFTCYGCNRFGDTFTLVQEMEDLSFPETINYLIEKFNIPVEKKAIGNTKKKDLYYKINQMALDYFRQTLDKSSEGEAARNYLANRGFSPETIKTFSLGLSEDRWDGLYQFLEKREVKLDTAVELGLLVKKDRGGYYDRFRGRIIFPIMSESGKVLAFGGRTLGDDPNKYINSPDTPIYRKGEYLYSFNLTKSDIRREKAVIVVEGYIDMISLYQNGIHHVVASLGTALTETQLYLIKRFSETIYLYYDSDKAGINAVLRATEKAFELNTNPRVILTEGDKDPDDFIRNRGREAFLKELEKAKDGFRFILERLSRKFDLSNPDRKRTAIDETLAYLNKIPDSLYRDEHLVRAATYFRVDENELRTRLRAPKQSESQVQGLLIPPDEKLFIESLLCQPETIPKLKSLFSDELLSIMVAKRIIQLIFSNYNEQQNKLDFKAIAENLNPSENQEFKNIFISSDNQAPTDQGKINQQIESSLLNFNKKLNIQKTRDIDQKIRIAERENNLTDLKRLLALKNDFIKERFRNSAGGRI